MERHLTDHDYFVGGRFTIADIALYAYTHMAPEAGFDLESYPAVRAHHRELADATMRMDPGEALGAGDRLAQFIQETATKAKLFDRIWNTR
ncbi:MAG TPA: glutathione binding-like protein [Solirubrobacterales bacterium]|nr:glutathione binding-like protein [Solirubrobacterales bacterium]